MCGIVGLVRNNEVIESKLLSEMCQTIEHRGPDDYGLYASETVGLGHRRLSIIDLSETGAQPMYSSDRQIIMIYNGETYNYLEIKQELVAKGYSFRGTSDTETIINGYLEWGEDIFQKLNGIFSLALLDKRSETLYLARDRFGVKPLYYYLKEGQFVFGSEIKSILKGGVKPRINYQGLHEFLYYGHALAERTLYQDIIKLIPGTFLKINIQTLENEIGVFWKHEDMLPELNGISEGEAIKTTTRLLESAVQRQLISDVPVGVFLSGGIDSSAITAFATKHYKGSIASYSAGFDFNDGHNELPAAKKIAKHFGTNHHEIMIKGGELPDIIEKMIFHHDEPFSDAANIPLYLLTDKVKNEFKVILQGDGGDEMFAGYSRYHILQKTKLYKAGLKLAWPFRGIIPSRKIRNQVERFYPILTEKDKGRLFAKLLTIETEERAPDKVLSNEFRERVLQYNAFEYYQRLAERFKNLKGLPQKMLWVDSLIILPDQFLEKVDKSTMASSVEVRVPFLDNELSSFAMRLPGSLKVKKGIKKYILKKALHGIVPNDVLYGPKKGFGVPYQNWIKGPLFDYLISHIKSDFISNLGLFDEKYIDQLVRDHKDGRQNNGFLLWKLLNLTIWLKMNKVEL